MTTFNVPLAVPSTKASFFFFWRSAPTFRSYARGITSCKHILLKVIF